MCVVCCQSVKTDGAFFWFSLHGSNVCLIYILKFLFAVIRYPRNSKKCYRGKKWLRCRSHVFNCTFIHINVNYFGRYQRSSDIFFLFALKGKCCITTLSIQLFLSWLTRFPALMFLTDRVQAPAFPRMPKRPLATVELIPLGRQHIKRCLYMIKVTRSDDFQEPKWNPLVCSRQRHRLWKVPSSWASHTPWAA